MAEMPLASLGTQRFHDLFHQDVCRPRFKRLMIIENFLSYHFSNFLHFLGRVQEEPTATIPFNGNSNKHIHILFYLFDKISDYPFLLTLSLMSLCATP